MTKIRIIAENSFGHDNQDLSITVPDSENLAKMIGANDIPKSAVPKATTFEEYLGYTNQRINASSALSFPAVEVRPLYMLWMEKRREWIGIKFDYTGSNNELDGMTEYIETEGPYKLDERCAQLIRRAYRSMIPLENVLHTPPLELKRTSRKT
jgi:hypothetical protein